MDHPLEVAGRVDAMLSVLSGGGPGDDPAGPAGTGDGIGREEGGEGTGEEHHALAVRRDLAWALARAVRAEPTAVRGSFARLLELVGAGRDSDADHDRHLLDALGVADRADPLATTERLVSALEDDEPIVRRRALDAVYRLEHRHARDDHPLLAVDDLREAVDDLTVDPDGAVREAAEDVETVHAFHDAR